MAEPGRDERVSDIEILREVALSPDPIVTAKEMADRVDYTRQGINNRLNGLIDDGFLERREVGSKAVVYWITDRGQEQVGES